MGVVVCECGWDWEVVMVDYGEWGNAGEWEVVDVDKKER